MPIDQPWIKGDRGDSNAGQLYVTTSDQSVADRTHLTIEEYYEIGSNFATELVGSGGILSITSPYSLKQFVQSVQSPDADQLVNAGNEFWVSDTYELTAGVSTELEVNSNLTIGYPTYQGFRSGVDSSGGFIEILTTAQS